MSREITETDLYPVEPAREARGSDVVLYVAFRADDPASPPSRHVVSAIDRIELGRGEPRATRTKQDGLRCLAIRVPDPRMSAQHGQLFHTLGTWLLDDATSKNGALVHGQRTRSCPLAIGDVFVLGHTVFYLAREPASARRDVDTTAGELAPPVPQLATFDPAFRGALDRMAQVAATELPILLLGETGTGKEVTARALHELSRRRGAFVAVNCGAITDTLVESELFGHRRGAFTGALVDKLGYLRTADGGTLFLDEIGELPLTTQTALLRVLQERAVVPVGEAMPVPIDLRVCAATHRDLGALVASGAFREDLYARLLGLSVTLPPLRARRADLGLLIATLLRRMGCLDRVAFTPAAAARLFEYPWPRNIRELERALAVMVALAGDRVIGIEHIPEVVHAPAAPARATTLTDEDHALKQRLEGLMDVHEQNVTEVARRLGKDRKQVYRWLRRLGIRRT